MKVGTADAEPGERATGHLEVTGLPTASPERLPVVIARGAAEGPTLWLTGGVHGNEYTGVATVQDALAPKTVVPLLEELAGTIVGVPICNPSGLRRGERTSAYHDDDPNRFFPPREADATVPERTQERANRRLFEALAGTDVASDTPGDSSDGPATPGDSSDGTDPAATADALLDVHTAHLGSMPFVIQDRVLYGADRTEEEATALASRLAALADATGLPVVTEFGAEEYRERNLHRSTAGAALNHAGIPAVTLELGSSGTIESGPLAAGVAAVYRAAVHLGMLEAVPEPVAGAAPAFDAPIDEPVRRHLGPRTGSAGLLRHHVPTGEVISEGQPLADVLGPHGEIRETVTSDHEGYVLGRLGPVVHENDAVTALAVVDDGPAVVERED